PFLNRERQNAIGDAIQVNLDARRRRRSFLGFRLLLRRGLLALGWLGARDERIVQVLTQRNRKRPRALRETEIEVQLVVHRVIVALTDEVQILALGVERRACVAQSWTGDLRGLAVFDVAELDRARLRRIGKPVGEPTAVE